MLLILGPLNMFKSSLAGQTLPVVRGLVGGWSEKRGEGRVWRLLKGFCGTLPTFRQSQSDCSGHVRLRSHDLSTA